MTSVFWMLTAIYFGIARIGSDTAFSKNLNFAMMTIAFLLAMWLNRRESK